MFSGCQIGAARRALKRARFSRPGGQFRRHADSELSVFSLRFQRTFSGPRRLTVMPSRTLFLVCALLPAGLSAQQNLVGTWQGTVRPPDTQADLRTVVKITQPEGEGLKATFHSIDQTFQVFPTVVTTLQGPNVRIEIPGVGCVFEGKVSADGNTISGTIKRGFPMPIPWSMKRVLPGEQAWTIPQPPPPLKPLHDADPTFDVYTVKLSRPDERERGVRLQGQTINVYNMTINQLMTLVYDVHPHQIIGAPSWFESEHFDITAKVAGDGQPSLDQARIMMRKLFADSLKLALHKDTRELPVYTLSLARGGSKLSKSDGDKTDPFIINRGPGSASFLSTSMGDLCRYFQQGPVERPVLDETGLSGRFDFALVWSTPEMQNANVSTTNALGNDRADLPPDLFTAVQQQLGLRLEAARKPLEVLVIEKVEKPTAN